MNTAYIIFINPRADTQSPALPINVDKSSSVRNLYDASCYSYEGAARYDAFKLKLQNPRYNFAVHKVEMGISGEVLAILKQLSAPRAAEVLLTTGNTKPDPRTLGFLFKGGIA
jgi:hypothetical protein